MIIKPTPKPRSINEEVRATVSASHRLLMRYMTVEQRRAAVLVIGNGSKVTTTTRDQLAAELRWNGNRHLAQECTGRIVPDGSVLVYSPRWSPPQLVVAEIEAIP